MNRNLRVSLLEEAKSPTQYADELALSWKRLSGALRKASFVAPDSRYRVDGHDVLMQSYEVGKLSIANLVSFPDTDDLDIRIIRNPEIVPEAVVSQFRSTDSGKTWIRVQYRFLFDDADSVRRVVMALQDKAMKLIDRFRDDEDKEGFRSTDPNQVTRSIKTVSKREPKIVTGRRS